MRIGDERGGEGRKCLKEFVYVQNKMSSLLELLLGIFDLPEGEMDRCFRNLPPHMMAKEGARQEVKNVPP